MLKLVLSLWRKKCKKDMQALREIVNVKDNLLRVVLPADFKADKVEIIIWW